MSAEFLYVTLCGRADEISGWYRINLDLSRCPVGVGVSMVLISTSFDSEIHIGFENEEFFGGYDVDGRFNFFFELFVTITYISN